MYIYMNTRRLVGPELTLKHKSEQSIICVDASISDPRWETQYTYIYMCGLRWYNIFDYRVINIIFPCVAWWGITMVILLYFV